MAVEDGKALLEDKYLAQMTGEALASRLYNYKFRNYRNENVFLINATEHYMCFLHFKISDEYLDQVKGCFRGNGVLTSFIEVTSTSWFNLCEKGGRDCIVQNLHGIVVRGLKLIC